RKLLFTIRTDRQLWYMHGMSCANLVVIERMRSRPVDLLVTLHCEGLTSLETALTMKPEDAQLCSDLGQCWERYAEDLARANKCGSALIALARGITYQIAARLAMPNAPSCGDRLTSVLIKAAKMIGRMLTALAEPRASSSTLFFVCT